MSLTIYGSDKKVVVHCHFVFIVYGRVRVFLGVVEGIAEHGGKIETRPGRAVKNGKTNLIAPRY